MCTSLDVGLIVARRTDIVVDGRPVAVPADGLALPAGEHVITYRMT